MAASKEDIRRWLTLAKEKGSTHMLVICDTFDFEDYPSFFPEEAGGKTLREVIAEHRNANNFNKVMEVYSLSISIENQLEEHHVWNVEDPLHESSLHE